MRNILLSIGLMLLIGLIITGCGHSNDPGAKKEPVLDAIRQWQRGKSRLAMQGGDIYANYCAICHGENLDGQGFNAYLLDPKPADLRSLAEEQYRSHVLKVIEKGTTAIGKSSLCPPWGGILPQLKREATFEYLLWKSKQ